MCFSHTHSLSVPPSCLFICRVYVKTCTDADDADITTDDGNRALFCTSSLVIAGVRRFGILHQAFVRLRFFCSLSLEQPQPSFKVTAVTGWIQEWSFQVSSWLSLQAGVVQLHVFSGFR